MGLIVDFVPNHMSADPRWNRWWRHVLANGPSSSDSEYFDIDWYPVNSNVHGKVLLAILGKQYGEVLESGELRIEFIDGEFCLLYGGSNLPLNPRQMKFLLRHRWEQSVDEDVEPDVRQEFESILFHMDHTPDYREAGPQARIDRERETEVATRRLVALIARSPALRRHLDSVIAEFNGRPGRPESFDLIHALLEQQPYRLAFWRTAMQEINYRRFFDINELIGLRMEYKPLFRAAHAKLFELARRGMIDGVRLDHIDGLLDPQGYLLQFRAATGEVQPPLYLVVEKILARQEWVNADWPVEGTTGYEFLALLNGLWVREERLREIDGIYRSFCGRTHSAHDVVYNSKRLITTTSMAGELNVLAHELNDLSERNRRSRDFTLDGLQRALREVVACFPVYRTYISERGFCPSDEMAVNQAVGQARRRNPALESSIFEFIRTHICPVRQPDESSEAFDARLRFAMKFQQYTSPVQAKGMEDTVFYRYSPLASLNEVGSGAGRQATTPREFHDANLHRMERWPDAMLTTSTHDTKHGEDARMRIHVLAEMPEEWKLRIREWSRINKAAKSEVNGRGAPDAADEYLYYQNLLGMWPPRQTAADEDTVHRMKEFMNKALKEAKVHTSWINPSNDYDAAAENFVEQTLRGDTSEKFLASFLPFADRLAMLGAWGSIAQVALKLASPGVVDTYQGGELWNLSLVDPDNRRPVDYAARQESLQALLERIAACHGSAEQRSAVINDLFRQWPTGELKLLYTALGLGLRAKNPDLFARGRYCPLQALGPRADHIVAFAREHEGTVLLTIAARWFASLLSDPEALPELRESMRETILEIPCVDAIGGSTSFVNLLTGAEVRAEKHDEVLRIPAGDALAGLPAAWLIAGPAQASATDIISKQISFPIC
jgi:(1->4)-alpha-D-glucan 1-alpha-D-glucosylmutase